MLNKIGRTANLLSKLIRNAEALPENEHTSSFPLPRSLRRHVWIIAPDSPVPTQT